MSDLRLGKLNIHHPGADGRRRGEGSRVTLSLFTPKGQVREVPVSERDLLVLAQDAARFALILYDHQEVRSQ